MGRTAFCETLKAKHQLAQSLFPNFLEYSRFVRRCNTLLPSIQVIRQALVFKEVEGISVSIIDSFPLPLCQPIRNFRSKVLGDYANVGYNATKGQYFYGYKCHALVSESGYAIDYTITPASMADSSMTEEVLSQFRTPTVLGDMGYLGQSLHDRLELKGIDLITPARKNMKQKKILGDMGYLGQSLHDRLELKEIDLITPARKNMKQKKILFPNFSKRRKVIERVFSFPVTALASGGADVVQYFGFALNLSQQIAYLFGEEELFSGDYNQLPEEARIRFVAYLGFMFGVGGSSALIANVSKTAGKNLGKKVAQQALTKTAWYPLVKKIGSIIGFKITKQSIGKSITKVIPVIGGVISGGLTYMTFKPMGNKLVDTFVGFIGRKNFRRFFGNE